MSKNTDNSYELDARILEIYDQTETQTADVQLLRRLIGGRGPLRILEPFCGHGRILIPLAQDGHEIVGIDESRVMLDGARARLGALPATVREKVTLIEGDVTAMAWPTGFDVVLLAGNCFYELATAQEQEGCVASAAAALRSGGHVYVDNNHMEGELDESWRRPGVDTKVFPRGTCADGTRVEGTCETTWYDAPRRLVRFRRTATLRRPDGSVLLTSEWIQQKHPPSSEEVRGWLEQHGFVIEQLWGDRDGQPYTPSSPRAIFWARKHT